MPTPREVVVVSLGLYQNRDGTVSVYALETDSGVQDLDEMPEPVATVSTFAQLVAWLRPELQDCDGDARANRRRRRSEPRPGRGGNGGPPGRLEPDPDGPDGPPGRRGSRRN